MDPKARHYPESAFGGFTDIDGTVNFYQRVNALLEESSVVLDVGCGRGAYADDPVGLHRDLRVFKGRVRRVIGIDVDRAARDNPFLDEFRPIAAASWPVEDASVDLVVCDWVVEHVDEPEEFLRECRRVLRPGGYLCIRTTNVRSYVGLMSRLIPQRLHGRVVAGPLGMRAEPDVFPTVYRCNTRARLRTALERQGFDAVVYAYAAEPSYLAFNRWLYALGVAHNRFAPAAIKPTLLAYARRAQSVRRAPEPT